MCAVSVIYDYGRQMKSFEWKPESLESFKKLIDAANEFDKVAEQPHCEDPGKAAWLEEVERQMREARV